MKLKYLYAFIIISLCCFLVACGGKKEYSVDYINEKLDNTSFVSMKYKATIKNADVIVYELEKDCTLEGEVYNVSITTKQLNVLEGDTEYLESTNESQATAEEIKILLELKKEYFSEVKVSKNSLEGKVLDEKVGDLLFIENASNVSVNIKLSDDLLVDTIVINFVDSQTNFTYSISVDYDY